MARKTLTRGEINCAWIEHYCRVPDGAQAGDPIRLSPFQRDIITSIYDNPAGTRLAIISLPRKQGKTSICSALMLLHLIGPEAVPAGQLFSAGVDKNIAGITFKLASAMLLQNPEIADLVTVRNNLKEIEYNDEELGRVVYKALSADGKRALGYSPVMSIFDEAGQQRGDTFELFDKLDSGSSAHDQSLTIIISTQAEADGDWLSQRIDEALLANDPHTVIKFWHCPDDVDWRTEEALELAMPAWNDGFVNKDYVRQKQQEAIRLPSAEGMFRNLFLNQRIALETPFIKPAIWRECSGEIEPMDGQTVYGGLDLAETTDLTSLVLMYRSEEGKPWSINPQYWIPDDELSERTKRDKRDYRALNQRGLINFVPGRVMDYAFVAQYLFDLSGRVTIGKIAFDRYNFRYLKPALIKAGFSEAFISEHFEEFGQGTVSMSPAIRGLEEKILKAQIRHGENPILTWNMDNVRVVEDEKRNRTFKKKHKTARIDGAIGLVMATAMLPDYGEVKAESYLASEPLLIIPNSIF